MAIEVDEETLKIAKEFQKKNEEEIKSKKLKPESIKLDNPSSNLIKINEASCRGRIKICNLLNVPISEVEYNNKDKIEKNKYIDQLVVVCGWSKAVRKQGGGRFCFVNLNDGSCHLNLQIVVNQNIDNYDKLLKCGIGCCFRFTGTLILSPVQNTEKKGLLNENVELTLTDNSIHSFEIYGENLDPQKYPLSKKNHGKEFLREVAHLRPRSYFISSVMRIRNALMLSTHLFFQSRGFICIHTPLITASDCEGGGEMFTVTTLFNEHGDISSIPKTKKKINNNETGKREDKNTNELETNNTNQYIVDFKKDFFSKQAFLTVSGQLSLENLCSSMGDVYTFGPTFRAENSHTSRHLAEFWMIEPEMAFADIYDNMELAEAYIRAIGP